MDLILATAQNDDRIHAVYMNGFRMKSGRPISVRIVEQMLSRCGRLLILCVIYLKILL